MAQFEKKGPATSIPQEAKQKTTAPSVFDAKPKAERSKMGSACKSSRECEPGTVCWKQACSKLCTSSDTCPQGSVCLPAGPGEQVCGVLIKDDTAGIRTKVELSPYIIWPTAVFLVFLVVWVAYAIYKDVVANDEEQENPIIVADRGTLRIVAEPKPTRAEIYAQLSPAGKRIIPEPFIDDIPTTPIERREFQEPLNMAAHISTTQPDIDILTRDPEIDSQSVWDK